ncbi:MAG: hypothetical protein ACK5VH_02485 [bacterium]|jgi:hypothetical protein
MSNPNVRPRWITMTAGLLFAAGIFNILVAFTGATARYGMFYPAAQVLLTIGYLTALSGIWEMERWGLLLLPVVLAVALATDLYLGAFRYLNLLAWVAVIAFWTQRKRFK